MTNTKQLMQAFIDNYQVGGDETSLKETISPNVVDHSRPPGISAGIQGVKEQFDGFHAAFSNFGVTVQDMIAEGDKLVTRKVLRGTHTGEFQGVPPTGRDVEIQVIDVVRFEDGQVVEHWNCVDRLGLLIQLGAVAV